MATARAFEVDEGVVSAPVVKVNKACKYFGEKGDEGLAHNLQGKEFDKKHDWNREVRRNARMDVPLARAAYDEEEERLQRQRMEFLQNQTKLAEADARLARQFQREEEHLAKEEDERRRRRREAKDRELAKRFEEIGFRDECDSKVDGEDGREFNSSWSSNRPLGIENLAYLRSFAGLGVRRSRDNDDDDDIPEEERRHLMMLQDQELALALQEYESLKALRTERHRTKEENRLQRNEEEHKTNGVNGQTTNPVYSSVPFVPSSSSSSSASSSSPRSRTARRQETTQSPAEATARQQQQQQQQQSSPGPANWSGPLRPSGDSSVSERPSPVQPNPNPSSPRNGRTADRSVTMVTSVGNSAFYKNVGAKKTGSQASAVEGKSSPKNPGKMF